MLYKKIIPFLLLLAPLFSSVSCNQLQKLTATEDSTKANEKIDNRMILSDEEWKKKLTANQYYILREKGTEQAHTGVFNLHKENGTYYCAGCGSALFSSDAKFDSHCGWPSFDKEIGAGKIIETKDESHGMVRTEITCAKCGGHLGHVFDDGPTATGIRYCVNSGSLSFEANNNTATTDTITLGGGCFWCTEAVFEELKGVQKVESGYSDGKMNNPNYEQVSSGETGHSEVVQITFNPQEVALSDILKVFFTVHDPTTMNRQGYDVGSQYRSGIYYRTEEQKKLAETIIAQLNTEKAYDEPIVTEVKPFMGFFKAEEYHQNYYANNKNNNSYCQAVIQPKLEKFYKVFNHLKK